jgi:hypothetical protein
MVAATCVLDEAPMSGEDKEKISQRNPERVFDLQGEPGSPSDRPD